jgi:hypothetical protein
MKNKKIFKWISVRRVVLKNRVKIVGRSSRILINRTVIKTIVRKETYSYKVIISIKINSHNKMIRLITKIKTNKNHKTMIFINLPL